jgi:hypothetical protein
MGGGIGLHAIGSDRPIIHLNELSDVDFDRPSKHANETRQAELPNSST